MRGGSKKLSRPTGLPQEQDKTIEEKLKQINPLSLSSVNLEGQLTKGNCKMDYINESVSPQEKSIFVDYKLANGTSPSSEARVIERTQITAFTSSINEEESENDTAEDIEEPPAAEAAPHKLLSDALNEEDINSSISRAEELEDAYASLSLPEGFFFSEDKLFYQELSNPEKAPPPLFICSKLRITAITRDKNNENFGRLLEFFDLDKYRHEWAMPMALLAGEGIEVREALLSQGLAISNNRKARSALISYIQGCYPQIRARCVDQVGWHGDCFVFPKETIGQSIVERVVFQTPCHDLQSYAISGTLDDWQQHLAVICRGNSRLLFALSIAFAAPLLSPLHLEGGGFHFRGQSSTGKSCALKIAASACGGDKHVRSWRATSNAMEGIAAWHNDGLLCLDEIGEVDPAEVGAIAYMLANGGGKGRLHKQGHLRKSPFWRVLFLSSGELSLSEHMQQAGKQAKAGQEVRLIDIPSDTGKYGIFEELHGYSSADALAKAIPQLCHQYHGTAVRAFIEIFIQKRAEAIPHIKKIMEGFTQKYLPHNADGQVSRVLSRFALVAVAGELATLFGITGWELGEASNGVGTCFMAWLAKRGGIGSLEEKNILSQVRLFFERHGDARFAPEQDEGNNMKTINRAGFKKTSSSGDTEFCVFKEVFRKEICLGFDPQYVENVCLAHGWLVPSAQGEPTRSERLPSKVGPVRCYRFNSKVLGEDS